MSTLQTGLLCEGLDYWFEASPEQVQKSKEKYNGDLVLSTCLQRADVKNQMGRVYPLRILQREFDNYQKLISDKCAYGEQDHPNQAIVEFKNASHTIINQYWKRNDEGQMEWWGDLRLLRNDIGKNIAAIIEQGNRVSVSSRGVGSVQYDSRKDADVVQEDFVIIAWDIVTNPSTSKANLIIKEGLDLHKNKYAHKRYLELRMKMLNEINLRTRSITDTISEDNANNITV